MMSKFHMQSDVIQVIPSSDYMEVTSEVMVGMASGVSTVIATMISNRRANVNVREL